MRDLAKLMRQIKAMELNVKEVIFIMADGSRLVFKNPKVVEAVVMGQKSYQIVGEPERGINPEDIKFVAEQAGVDEETARKALEESGGDIAEAILKLQERN